MKTTSQNPPVQVCLSELKEGINPVIATHRNSKIAIIRQVPRSLVYRMSIPWDDKD